MVAAREPKVVRNNSRLAEPQSGERNVTDMMGLEMAKSKL